MNMYIERNARDFTDYDNNEWFVVDADIFIDNMDEMRGHHTGMWVAAKGSKMVHFIKGMTVFSMDANDLSPEELSDFEVFTVGNAINDLADFMDAVNSY